MPLRRLGGYNKSGSFDSKGSSTKRRLRLSVSLADVDRWEVPSEHLSGDNPFRSDPLPDADPTFGGRLTQPRRGSVDGVAGGSTPGQGSGAPGSKHMPPTFRDMVVRAVKSMETEAIKDEKRLRFVEDIYEGNENPDFMSPLARRKRPGQEDGENDIQKLRAQREAAERAMIGVTGVPGVPPEGSGGEADGEGVASPSPSRFFSKGAVAPSPDVNPRMVSIGPTSPEEPEGGKLGKTVVDYVGDAPEVQLAMAEANITNRPGIFPKKSSRAVLDDNVDDVWIEALRLTRLRIWIFLDDPDSSRLAYLTSCAILCLILISSVTFCLETMHNFEDVPERTFIFFVIECICIGAFTTEYVLKLLCAPKTLAFIVSPLNMVDFISIIPFYLEQAVSGGGVAGTRVFRTIRLVRVFRVLKLGGRFSKIQVVATVMWESLDMLGVMLFLLSITVVIFSTLIYFAERGDYYEEFNVYSRKTDISCDASVLEGTHILEADGKTLVKGCERVESPYKSIPDSFWWCIVTLMTVGYGDESPITSEGKLVACLAMLVSVLLLALPISVIGTEFTQQWMEYKTHSSVDGHRRRLAPKFVELREKVKDHISIVDETLRKMRDTRTEMDDRLTTVRQLVHMKHKEQEALKRKALIKGKQAVAALLENKVGKESDERRFAIEVMELIDERERLRQSAELAEMMQSDGFAEEVEDCMDKYVFMSELKESDYEMITAEIDDLHWRAAQWYDARRREGTPGNSATWSDAAKAA